MTTSGQNLLGHVEDKAAALRAQADARRARMQQPAIDAVNAARRQATEALGAEMAASEARLKAAVEAAQAVTAAVDAAVDSVQPAATHKKPFFLRGWFILLMLFVLVGLVIGTFLFYRSTLLGPESTPTSDYVPSIAQPAGTSGEPGYVPSFGSDNTGGQQQGMIPADQQQAVEAAPGFPITLAKKQLDPTTGKPWDNSLIIRLGPGTNYEKVKKIAPQDFPALTAYKLVASDNPGDQCPAKQWYLLGQEASGQQMWVCVNFVEVKP